MTRTHRLELDDQTLRDWDAVVLEAGPEGVAAELRSRGIVDESGVKYRLTVTGINIV